MWVRIASKYQVGYSPKCLAAYRSGHNTSISSKSVLSGKNIKDLNQVIKTIGNYLPRERKSDFAIKAKKHFSIYYSWGAYRLYKKDIHKNKELASKMAFNALKLHFNIRSVYWQLRLLVERARNFLNINSE
jgi:hypothetical protein